MIRIALLTSVLLCTAPLYAQKLYSIDGKDISLQDLTPSSQQSIFEIELQRYKQMEGVAHDQLLANYFEEKAKKSKKTKEEVEADEFKAGNPTDKELKAFFEENKSRIPPNYTFDQVKPELTRFLTEKKVMEKKQALITSLKKQRHFKMLLDEPKAPVVDLKTEGFYSKGKAGAKIKIVEFADYQCPHCREASMALSQLMKKYSAKVEFVYVDFPINRSGISTVVAEGAYCANKQNKYWDYHDLAFKDQASLTKESPLAFAKQLKLKEDDFSKCLAGAEAKSFIAKGKDEGNRVGVSGTPAIFINGSRYSEAHDFETMKKTIDKL